LSELNILDPPAADISVSKSWLRALELTASIPRNRERLLADAIEELAKVCGDAPALLSDGQSFTYAELVQRSNQYAHWAIEQGLTKGDVVGLLMPNRPEYLAIWLGVTRIGAVVALLNTNLSGPSLAHCIDVVSPYHLIVDADLAEPFATSLPALAGSPALWIHGGERAGFRDLESAIRRQPSGKIDSARSATVTVEDRALYIYTSGTTGLPKAANVSHARLLQWSYWFAGMMGAVAADRMYNCLPMYHSVGGVLAPGAMLVSGGSVVLREKFSASRFWSDIERWDCTMFQYIGEFCRYLLHSPHQSSVRNHRVRIACGNGLAPDIWERFKSQFAIPRVLEFYAATEGGISLFNVEEKQGSIGRIPAYLAHRFAPALVRFDVDKGEPVRDDRGFCVRTRPNEPGEALGKLLRDPSGIGSRFEGYTDEKASEKKILRNVFETGDAWVRTGDLMRRDEKGFFYFVDRIGDTFRWKGENVSTSEVSEVICSFPGVRHAIVYGVTVAGADGRAGMAALSLEGEIDFDALKRHFHDRLPTYARPIFLRITPEVQVTGTFKYSRADLVREGFDPAASADPIYFDDPEKQSFRQLDADLFERVQSGRIRL
jgi:fatty-acyl-CoA synthase